MPMEEINNFVGRKNDLPKTDRKVHLNDENGL